MVVTGGGVNFGVTLTFFFFEVTSSGGSQKRLDFNFKLPHEGRNYRMGSTL